MNRSLLTGGLALGLLAFFAVGCATPGGTQPSRTRIIDPSQEDNVGGSFIESSDIQTIASRMAPAIMSVPEIAGNPGVTRIAMAPVRNSTRYVIDKDILMKRLRIELSRHGQGRVRFFSQTVGKGTRTAILKEREEDVLEGTMDTVANYLVSSPTITSAPGPVKVAVTPALNTNFVNMNADSYVALLRAKIAERAAGKILFAAPGADPSLVDYELTGEFIAKSIKKEGIITPFDDAKDATETEQKNMDVKFSVTKDGAIDASVKKHESSSYDSYDAADKRRYRDIPDITKYLNVMLVDTSAKVAVFEKLFTIEKKIVDGVGRANLLLTGELSALSKAGGGDRSDYVIVSFQLVDPQSNEILWEDAYETKRVTSVHVIYK